MFAMENNTNNGEKVLITNLKNGSHKAFDTIYKMYAKRLYAYSYQYTKSVEDAEDIVQEVFINLWKNRTTIRQNDTLQSLLFVMAKYKLINAYRSKINNEEYKGYQELMKIIAVEDTIQRVEYNDSLRQFMDVLSKLPVTQQRVIQLSRFKKLTNKVIAETLSLSEQTVKNQLSIGLKTLREKLLYIVLSILFM
jgi:RNA polymerase sigma-70 factor (family 1)